MNDVVIFSKTLKKYLNYLRQIFTRFVKIGISVNPRKAYLEFPSVQLLGQKIDSFELSTAKKKLKAISLLRFPKTLKELEIYLGITG